VNVCDDYVCPDDQECRQIEGVPSCVDMGPVACTEEARICCDGSVVFRNSDNNCLFDPCPAFCPNGPRCCEDLGCPSNTICIENEVRCLIPPCPRFPECVEPSTCDVVLCPENTDCVEREVPCATPPCITVAECIPLKSRRDWSVYTTRLAFALGVGTAGGKDSV